jgi:benzoate-CoA ligase family protein
MTAASERYNAGILLDANLEAGRAGKAAILCDGECVTYGDLYDQVCAMGRALRALGVARENRVLLALDDTLAFPIAFLGALRLGAVPVPINPAYRAADYRFFLDDSDASAGVVEATYRAKLGEALADRPEPIVTIVANGPADEGAHALADLLEAHRGPLPPANTHRDDMAFWLYTGGSTGMPKAVVHLQHDIPVTCEAVARHVVGLEADDVILGRALFHAYGLGCALTFPLWAGATSVLVPGRPTPARILEAVARRRATLLCLVPTLYNMILNDPAAAAADLSSLRLCLSAAEPLAPEIWRRWQDRFGVTILDGIGSTEMLHIFCANTLAALRPGSSGKPVPGYELRLCDELGHPVPVGEVGHLLVRGDSAAPAYWRQHEKSKRTMQGEWVATGDRYRVDEDGFYWYEGRADDMIKIGGEWVSPIAIENALLEHPAVRESAVVGVPIEGIMRIRAVVIPQPDALPGPALVSELQEWCKGRLQRYQYPHVVDFAGDLPKTATGKVQRFKLREGAR